MYLPLLAILLYTACPVPIQSQSQEQSTYIENAFLQTLHYKVVNSLQEHYRLELVQFECEHITNIQVINLPAESEHLKDGLAYRITIQVHVMVPNELLLLTFRNDGKSINIYELENLKVIKKNH